MDSKDLFRTISNHKEEAGELVPLGKQEDSVR